MSMQPLVFRRLPGDVLLAPDAIGLIAIPDLLRQVQAAFEQGACRLLVDLSEVRVMDISALRALVWARRHAHVRGGELCLVPPPEGVLRDTEAMLMHQLFPIYLDRTDAWSDARPDAAAALL